MGEMKWQRIETAPKDGTEVLAFREDAGIFIARWGAPIDFCPDYELEDLDEYSANSEDWFCADFDMPCRLEEDEAPTHWMPLPDPPEG